MVTEVTDTKLPPRNHYYKSIQLNNINKMLRSCLTKERQKLDLTKLYRILTLIYKYMLLYKLINKLMQLKHIYINIIYTYSLTFMSMLRSC